MEQRNGNVQIRRKPVGSGSNHNSDNMTTESEAKSNAVTSAQIRDVSSLDTLTAILNSQGRTWDAGDNVSSQSTTPATDGSPPATGTGQGTGTRTATVPRPKLPPTSVSDLSCSSRDGLSEDGRSTTSKADTKTPIESSRQVHQLPNEDISLYFSRTFLIGLATTFVIIILALEVLNLFSERHNGIVAVDEKNHYLWTYGPTFILTLFVALWGQLEHRAKHLMPWLAMMNGPVEAREGILLDYITPLTISSLYHSAKRKHFLVTLAILGGLTLRFLVIVSTGLLSVVQQTMVREVNVTTIDRFNLTKEWDRGSPLDPGLTIWGITERNLPYPAGTTDRFTTQSIELSEQDHGDTVTVPLAVFSADLVNCSEFSWTYVYTPGVNMRIVNLTSEDELAELGPYCNYPYDAHGEEQQLITDSGNAHWSERSPLKLCGRDPDDPTGIKYYNSFRWYSAGNVASISATLCDPVLSFARRLVTVRSTPGEVGTVVSVDPRVIEDLPLGNSVYNVSGDAGILGDAVLRLAPTADWDRAYPALMNFTSPRPTRAELGEMSHFRKASRRTYQFLAAQGFKQRNMDPFRETVKGELSYTSNRLVVEKVSLRIMEALLALLAVISSAFCFFPLASLPTRSGFMITLSSILSRSPQLMRVLHGTGIMGKQSFGVLLSTFKFGISSDRSPSEFSIVVQPKKKGVFQRIKERGKQASPSEWWKPFAARKTYKALLLVATVGVIITLESLLQHSIGNQGLGGVSDQGYTKYTWLFVPAVTMAGFALSYSTVDVTYRLLHPFQQLHDAQRPNLDEMKYDPLGKLTATAIVRAIKRHHFALAAIMATSLLGPTLTIVASGLFSPSLVPGRYPTDVNITGWFDFGFGRVNTSFYRCCYRCCKGFTPLPDTAVNQAILFSNLSYPPGTYEGFVFPKLDISLPTGNPAFQREGFSNRTDLVVRLPAIRPQMNCTVHMKSDGKLNLAKGRNTTFRALTVEPPAGCDPHPNPNITTDRSKMYIGVNPDGVRGIFAAISSISWSIPDNDTWPTTDADKWDSWTNCNDDREHVFATYGHNTKGGRRFTDEVTVLHCMPYLESVLVDATFAMPNLIVGEDVAKRPVVVEGTAKPWEVEGGARRSILQPQLTELSKNQGDGADLFFHALFNWKGRVLPEEITPRGREEEMMAQMNKLHQILVVQGLNEHYRSPPPNTSALANGFFPMANGTLVDGTRLRLLQSPISTRLLEGLLLAMLLCCLAVFFCSGPTAILPKNPGSIASRMSLLADSTILYYITEPTHAPSNSLDGKGGGSPDTASGKEELFSGDTFSLGWWHVDTGSRYAVDLGLSDTGPR